MSITIEKNNGSRAVLVRLSRNVPVFCAALGRAVPYAVLVLGGPNGVEICDLSGNKLPAGITPLGLATAADAEVVAIFRHNWK
jgi:hypothetical protein